MTEYQVKEIHKSYMLSKMREWHCNWAMARRRLGIFKMEKIRPDIFRCHCIVEKPPILKRIVERIKRLHR